jgi:hypothetical protein
MANTGTGDFRDRDARRHNATHPSPPLRLILSDRAAPRVAVDPLPAPEVQGTASKPRAAAPARKRDEAFMVSVAGLRRDRLAAQLLGHACNGFLIVSLIHTSMALAMRLTDDLRDEERAGGFSATDDADETFVSSRPPVPSEPPRLVIPTNPVVDAPREGTPERKRPWIMPLVFGLPLLMMIVAITVLYNNRAPKPPQQIVAQTAISVGKHDEPTQTVAPQPPPPAPVDAPKVAPTSRGCQRTGYTRSFGARGARGERVGRHRAHDAS